MTALAVAAPRRHSGVGPLEIAGTLVGLGLGAFVAVIISDSTSSARAAPGGWALLVGNVTAIAGTYLLLIMVVLAARLPVIERVAGADRLLLWHRWLGPWPIVLLGAHTVATTLGYAQSAHSGIVHEASTLLGNFRDVLAATVAYGLLLTIALSSIRAARRRVSYETWWILHLYTYLAIALSLAHQFYDGTDFVGHRLVSLSWGVLWIATAGVVAVYRLGLPAWRNLSQQLRIEQIVEERPGVTSVIIKGRHLDRLSAAGGQFFLVAVLHPPPVVAGTPVLTVGQAEPHPDAHHRQRRRRCHRDAAQPAARDPHLGRGSLWCLHRRRPHR